MKITYNEKSFDSELEVEYYKYLQENDEVIDFTYHPTQIPNLVFKRSYTPDFIVEYEDRIEVIETKGYNPYSFRIDDAIHSAMLSKDEMWLKDYVAENGFESEDKEVIYRKIKKLIKYGWVDFDFKNPNTLSSKRKEKVINLKCENQILKTRLKDYDRYFKLTIIKDKRTKKQEQWIEAFIEETTNRLNEK